MLYAFYDLQTMPCNYDFFTFAVIAKSEANRLRKECHIVFVPGCNEGFQKPNKKEYSIDEHKFRLNHILFPACYSLGLGYTYCRTREHAEYIQALFDNEIFPEYYDIHNPPTKLNRSCSLCHTLEQHNKHKLLFPEPTQFAVDLVKNEFPEPPVVITLRETYKKGRNSSLEDWMNFAYYLWYEKDEVVVFVRDTSQWNTKFLDKRAFLDELELHEIFPLASIDLDVRLALYKYAKINFSVGGGPTVLMHYSTDVPYRTFKFHSNEHGSSHENFLRSMGFPVGSQWPWATKDQRIIWELDNFENLKREYDLWLTEPN